MDHDNDEYKMRDPVAQWARYQTRQEAERRRETVRRQMRERAMTREAQQAAALPAQLVALEARLQRQFDEQLLTALKGMVAAVEAVERGFDRITAKVAALDTTQTKNQGVLVAVVADLVEARMRQASTLVDVTPEPASPTPRPRPRRPDRTSGTLN